MENLIINHHIAILKDIFQKCEREIKKMNKSTQSSVKNTTHASVVSSKHWRAVAGSELHSKQVYAYMNELKQLDSMVRWSSSKMNAYSFKNKYPLTLKKYELYS